MRYALPYLDKRAGTTARAKKMSEAFEDDPPPSVSPRLGLVLQHFGVTKRDCSGDYPDTLAKASCCLDTGCFGRKTSKVVHASMVRWNVIATAIWRWLSKHRGKR